MKAIANTLKGWVKPIQDALYSAYAGIMNAVRNPFEGLASYFSKDVNLDKQKLDNMRNKHFQLIQDEDKKASPYFVQTAKAITADTKKYVQDMIAEEMAKLGRAPCDFSVITLGSMARQESGPVTDLEIGFLIKDKTIDNYRYFYQLSQNLADRLFLLGEHPAIGGKGLRLDEADNAPPHLRFFARNATPNQAKNLLNEAIANREWDKVPYEGSRPFLATPAEFASYSKGIFEQNPHQLNKIRNDQFDIELRKALRDPKNKQKARTAQGRKEIESDVRYWLNIMYQPYSARELHTANEAGKRLGRNMALLYGNQSLYNQFINQRETYFNTREANGKTLRQNLAKAITSEDIRNIIQKGKSVYQTGELGKTLDIKRELYRFTEQFVTDLGFYHHCNAQNTVDIVNELVQKRVINADFGAKMVDFINFVAGLRLKEQVVLKRQGFAAYFDQAEFNEDKEDLEKEIRLIKESIAFMERSKQKPEMIAIKQRDLVKLEDNYQHLLDMAPGKILAAKDIETLKQKYLPFAKELFQVAQGWVLGTERIGFGPQNTNVNQNVSPSKVNTNPKPVVTPKASPSKFNTNPKPVNSPKKSPSLLADFTPAMQHALNFLRHNPNGFFIALSKLKQEDKQLDAVKLQKFVQQCQNEKLLTKDDFAKINALKANKVAVKLGN